LAEVPTLFDLLDQYKSPAIMRSLTRVILASGEMGRPMMAGPGVPPERIKALRDAYGRALRDPGLIEEAKKGQMDLEYTAGTELQAQIKEIISQPREVIELVKKVLTD
jgi:tripartite-type tricarboxylate transporter receptor subunit TctC